jgi:hypothetical protein
LDEAQMVVEPQMMVDTVVDLSCNTLFGALESANRLLLLPARTQHQSFCLLLIDMLPVINK